MNGYGLSLPEQMSSSRVIYRLEDALLHPNYRQLLPDMWVKYVLRDVIIFITFGLWFAVSVQWQWRYYNAAPHDMR